MLEKLFLIFMIAAALAAVATEKLRRTVIYLGVFSLASAFVFLLYSAPDVAIAEAVIAAAISTVLYLVAIKKHRAVTIYYIQRDGTRDKGVRPRWLKDLELYLIQKETEPQIIYTDRPLEDILDADDFDFAVEHTDTEIRLYAHALDRRLDELEERLSAGDNGQSPLRFVRYEKELT